MRPWREWQRGRPDPRRAGVACGPNGGLNHAGGSSSMGRGINAGDMDGEWRVTSEISFGSHKSMKGVASNEVRQEQMAKCGCNLPPVVRVCNEGFDAGRRFLSCPYEGLNSCGYLSWIDDEWQGRSKLVIQKLADDNMKLQHVLLEKEQEIHMMKKGRNKLDEKRKSRENLDRFLVLVFLASVVLYALVALLSRGFV